MNKKKNAPVTLKTMSEQLNISAMAVSKALRGDPSVSEKTREKVKALAKELNYRPNSIAKSLRTNETKTLGLVIADSSLSLFAPVIDGVENMARQMGYNIILSNAHSSVEEEKEAVRTLISKRIDGLLLAASTLTAPKYKKFLDSFGVPYVYLMRRCEFLEGDYVVSDNVNDVARMIEYLAKTGSKKIHFINLAKDIVTSGDREEGYRKGLLDSGIEYDSKLVYHVSPYIEAGKEQMTKILEGKEEVETVFCGCDMIAVGVLESILEHGICIPSEIRLASHDDIELAAYLRVPLTTIRAPKYEIGELGTKRLIEKITGEEETHIQHVLQSELVLRDST